MKMKNKMNEFMKKYGFWISMICALITLGVLMF